MAAQMYLVYPTEDWARSSTFSATSEQTGYGASNAGTDDPCVPWWANSTSATLTVTFGATREVGLIALVMTNADDARVITIAGGITGSPTLTGSREANNYPRDLVYIVDPPQNLTNITLAISSNTNKWSIGRVVVGKRRSLSRTFPVGSYSPNMGRLQIRDENHFNHLVPYDLGVQSRGVEGGLHLVHGTDLATLETAWNASNGGFYPVLFVPNVNHITRYPPIFARFDPSTQFDYYAPDMASVKLNLEVVSRGLEVVG